MNKFLLILLIATLSITSYSQEKIKINFKEFKNGENGFKDAKENIKKGNSFFKKKTKIYYKKAIDYYLKAYKYNSENAELNYKIGVAYLGTSQKKKSLKYILKAKELKQDISLLQNWQLGQAYHYNLMFDEAITQYKLFRQIAREYGAPTKKVKKRLEECKVGKKLVSVPTNAIVVKIKTLNTKYPDYCPLITADESMMIFTGRRPDSKGGHKTKDGKYFEDIYVSYNKNGKWSEAKNIGSPLNTDNHDATVCLSPDGQQLFLYYDRDIYASNLKGEKWSKPKRMPDVINSPDVEKSACISFDGKSLYFSRGKDVEIEKSNSDIYVSHYKNGKWTKAKKLPRIINSKYDEDGVFMHPDGKTLFFSSKGHNTMGGFDIFKSTLQSNGRWTKPENLGFPINTPEDDLYFVMSAKGENGYYSSIKDDGNGSMDIYKIQYSDTLIIKKDTVKKQEFMLTIVKGTVTDGITGKKLGAKIEIYDAQKNKNVLDAESNSSTGKYLISLPSGKNYGMQVRKEGYLFHSENFNIPKVKGYQEIIKNIKLYPVKKDVKIVLNNIFFDTDKSILRPESFAELDRLKKLLKDNKNIKIEISGHTDNQGSYKHNVKLSAARASSVVNYLISKGIDKNRLKSRGASWDEPISTNKTKEGRQKNRRVEFKII